jgi:TonB-dependent SusC/RagA subfamily outer membrane receptor
MPTENINNTNDITSYEILKDASAIYGTRAANGVISLQLKRKRRRCYGRN